MNRLQPAITAGLVIAAFACGILFTGARDIFYAPSLICLTLAALMAVLPGIHTGSNIISLPGRTPAALLFLFWVYTTLSLCWSPVPFISLVTWLIITSLPLIFFALSCADNRTKIIQSCAGGLMIATGILAFWVIGDSVLGGVTRSQGPMSDPNNMATLFNLCLLPALSCVLTLPWQDKKIIPAVLYVLILFMALVCTQSRSGLLALILTLPVLAIMLRIEKKRILMMIGAATVFVVLFHFAVSSSYLPRIWSLLQPASDGPASARMALWGSAWQMLLDNPWTGSGLGTFYLFYPAYRLPLADNSAGNWAHMDSLQLGVEMGVLAPILFYAFVISVFIRTNRALDQGRDAQTNMQMTGTFAGILSVIIQSHFNFPLYALPVLIVMGVWLAKWYDDCAALTDKPSYETAQFIKPWQAHFTGFCIIATALMFSGMAVSTAAGQYFVSQATSSISKNDLDGFIKNIESAEKFAPASFIDPKVQTAGFYIDMMNMPEPLLSSTDRKQMIEDSLTLLSQAESLNPAWAEINYKRGKLYSLLRPGDMQGEPVKADEEWRTALRKNPLHYKSRLLLAGSLMKKGRAVDAYEILATGLTYPLPAQAATQINNVMKQIRGVAETQSRLMQEMQRQDKSKPGKTEKK